MKAFHTALDMQTVMPQDRDTDVCQLTLEAGEYVVFAKAVVGILGDFGPIGGTIDGTVGGAILTLKFGRAEDRAECRLVAREGQQAEVASLMTAWRITAKDQARLLVRPFSDSVDPRTGSKQGMYLRVNAIRMTALLVDSLETDDTRSVSDPIDIDR